MKDQNIVNSQNHLKKLIEKDLPDLDKFFNDQAISFSPVMLKVLKDFVTKNGASFFESGINISIAIDTNTLFSCVYRKLTNNKESIIVALTQNPFVTIYYSDYVKTELINNIKLGKLNTKKIKIDIEEAILYAENLLTNFTLVNDNEINVYPEAEEVLGQRDPKDIPIINLTYSKAKHGLLTQDKDFEDFKNVKKWNIPELGGTLCLLNKGSITLFLTSITANVITEVLKFIFALIRMIFNLMIKVFKGIIQLITTIPKEMYLILGSVALVSLVAYLWNDTDRKIDKFIDNSGNLIRSSKAKVNDTFDNISDLLDKISKDES